MADETRFRVLQAEWDVALQAVETTRASEAESATRPWEETMPRLLAESDGELAEVEERVLEQRPADAFG